MDPKTLATKLVSDRLDQLRELARAQLDARQKHQQPPVVNVAAPAQPQITLQLVVPPEAFRIVVEQPAPQVTVNVPEQPAPRVTVQPAQVNVAAPVVKVEPKIEVTTPAADKPSRAVIKHADGSKSEVELK